MFKEISVYEKRSESELDEFLKKIQESIWFMKLECQRNHVQPLDHLGEQKMFLKNGWFWIEWY